nr:alpha/beta hydrolase-fold protein [Nocardioides flavescens]
MPGRTSLYRHLHLDGPDGVVPTSSTGETENGVLTSRARNGRRCGWSIACPAGPRAGLPVVVVLHGRGGDHSSAFSPTYLGLDRFRDATVVTGVPAYALASVDGGEEYWHARADGDDPAAMVVDEFLPLLAERGLDTSRLGLLGRSMGGYGALHLAGVLGRDRVSAVAAMSPALWRDYADTAPGA